MTIDIEYLKAEMEACKAEMESNGSFIFPCWDSCPCAVEAEVVRQAARIAALEAKVKAADECQWQPIETAPKDGTVVQGWVAVEHDLDGPSSEWVPKMRFHDNEWQHKHSHGWFDLNCSVITWRAEFPTHWMPLPDLPESRREVQS